MGELVHHLKRVELRRGRDAGGRSGDEVECGEEEAKEEEQEEEDREVAPPVQSEPVEGGGGGGGGAVERALRSRRRRHGRGGGGGGPGGLGGGPLLHPTAGHGMRPALQLECSLRLMLALSQRSTTPWGGVGRFVYQIGILF